MALRDIVGERLKEAMKARDKPRVSTLRMIAAGIKNLDIQNRTAGPDASVGDAQIAELMARMVKQRQESIALYERGGRADLVAQETAEIAVIQEFLPKQMGEDEVKSAIAAIVAETGASGMKDMGKVMATLKSRHAGQMAMAMAGALVKAALG